MTLLPMLGSVPHRSSPVSPEASARKSVAAETHAGEEGSGVGQKHLPGRSEPHRAGSTRAFEQLCAHDTFEVGDLLTNRRLGVVQRLGGPAEGARVGDSHESQQVP